MWSDLCKFTCINPKLPVVVAVPLQLRCSPGISLLLALLLRSQTGCLESAVCAAVSQPTHAISTCHYDEHVKQRARSGAKKCVCQPTCPPCSVGPTPPRACSDYGSERRRNQRRTRRLREAVAQRSLELVARASLFHKDIFQREDFTSVHEEISGQGMRQRCSFCY